jgi:hypothetical protein
MDSDVLILLHHGTKKRNWSGTQTWFDGTTKENPGVGRIQHHPAVSARPNIVQQLFYYSMALVSVLAGFSIMWNSQLVLISFSDSSITLMHWCQLW